MYGLGIPKNSSVKYDTSIKAVKFVLIAQGAAEEAALAQRVTVKDGAGAIIGPGPTV